METADAGRSADMEQRLAELERRLAALESRHAEPPVDEGLAPDAVHPERFWAVDVLRRRRGAPYEGEASAGSVLYAGSLTTSETGSLAWQVERPVPLLLQHRWDIAAQVLAALGHPVRLEIVRRLLGGAHSSLELMEIAEMQTTGRLYHHLRELQSAGLIVSPRRNHYAIPPAKVVTCLVIVAAAAELSVGTSGTEEAERS